jgi:hypothetical protein
VAAEDERAPERTSAGDRWIVAVAIVVAVLPLLVAAVRVLAAHRFATNADDALIELRVRDVGTSHTPLVGSYQRFGFNQPGPLLLWALAVPYRLLGSSFAAAQVGALLLNAVAVAAASWLVLRRCGTLAALAALGFLGVLMHAMGIERLVDPWEPNLTMLLVPVLLLLVWEATNGSVGTLPVLALIGSVLVQAQTSLAPVVGLLLVIALVALVVAVRRSSEPVRWQRPAVIAAAVIAVAWLPPFLYELGTEPSNAGRMLEFLRASHDTLGLRRAAKAVGLELSRHGSWLSGTTPLRPFVGTVDVDAAPAVPLGVFVVALAAIAALRRRALPEARLAAIVLVTCAAALVSLSRLTGPLFDWLLLWTWALAAVAWFAVALCAWAALPDAWRARATPAAVPVLLVVVALHATIGVLNAATSEPPRDRVRDAVLQLAGPAHDAVRDVRGPVLVDSTVEVPAELFSEGEVGVEFLALALERAGVDVLVHAPLANRFGNDRVDKGQAAAELRLVSDEDAAALLGARVVATVDPLRPEDRAELAEIEAALAERGLTGATLDELPPEVDADDITLIGRREGLASYPKISVVLLET